MSEDLWSYLIAYDGTVTSAAFRGVMDRLPSIVNWYTCMPAAAFVVSAASATEITRELRAEFDSLRFIVVDLQGDRNGVLPNQAWTFIKNPRTPERRVKVRVKSPPRS